MRKDLANAAGVIAFSEKENAAATWKRTFRPLLAFADRPEVAGGEALAFARETPGPTPLSIM